jgi:DNA replicative helicase MCM subunit Mcm2 (Cdc46/Mcm family)
MRLQAAIEFAANDFELKRDDEARALWHKVYPNLSESCEGLFGSVTSRAEAQVTRLSCVYALLDLSRIVSREHLEAALALWQYCEASARYIFGNATGDKIADALLTALRDAGKDGLTRTQIRDLFGRNANATRINDALSLLEKSQLVHSIKELSDDLNAKRPVERFFISTPYDINDINDFNQASDELTRNNVVNVVNVVSDSDELTENNVVNVVNVVSESKETQMVEGVI